jgi:3-hydroxybutyryl-CoA dehydrogenase
MNINTVGVAGLGLLGRGIAACLLAHGFKVIAFTLGDASHDGARVYVHRAIDDLIERAGFSPSLRESWPRNYVPVHTLDTFGPCDFVIESVIEDLAVKEQVFDELESVVRPEVPIASNTSSLPISHLQGHRRHPERFVGMHWAEPSHITRFIELIRGEQTGDAAFTGATQLALRLGKEPSLVQKDIPAFIVNRLGYAMYREAAHILEMGVADIETIDRSFRNACGLWATICGPFRWIDITGGPAIYGRVMQRILPSLANSTALPTVFQKMIDEDAKGTLDGHGFYSYTREEAEKWEALFLEHAWKVRELLNEYFPLAESEE